MAAPDAWFTYYYWLDEHRAPDFAHTVDIHRKPGYDPAELFLDPNLRATRLKIAWTLLKRKLGFRALMTVIGTDASLVRGSHGVAPTSPDDAPIFISQQSGLVDGGSSIEPTRICELILRHLTS